MLPKQIMRLHIIILICLSSTHPLHAGPGNTSSTVSFTGSKTNWAFDHKQLLNQKTAILPIRSSMGGGGTDDDLLHNILVDTIKKKLPQVPLFTDNMVDAYFTEKDMWDEYFAYITQFMAKGLGKTEVMEKLYSKMEISNIILITSDYNFSGIGVLYPKEFDIFVSLQIYDIKQHKVIWDGYVNAHDFIKYPKYEVKILKQVYRAISDKLLTEIMRKQK